MPEFVRRLRPVALLDVALLIALFLLAVSAPAPASSQGVYLPAPPSGPGGEDTIETASGTRCRQSMNSNGAYVDVGVTARTSNASDRNSVFIPRTDSGSEAIGYARVTLPLGKRPQRMDCSRLYEIEIARMQREIELLRLAAE